MIKGEYGIVHLDLYKTMSDFAKVERWMEKVEKFEEVHVGRINFVQLFILMCM